ncbi:MAG TPA: ribonuclease PH [Actinomycetota bacterium]|nr:ribonuclease PH [Actinomycetota bacterium]
MVRNDGRSPDQLRPVTVQRGFVEFAEGSVLYECGKTRVLVNATVDDRIPDWMRGSGKGWVTAEYSMLPRATETRTPREVTKGKLGGRTQEIQRLIGRSLRAICDMKAMGERTVWLDCDVLQADGGTRTASITAAYIALAEACNGLLAEGKLARNPVLDQVAAVSVGMVNGVPCLDLDYSEDSAAEVDMNIVMTGTSEFVELQGTAEGKPFSDQELAALLSLGRKGIGELLQIQRTALQG